MKLSEAVARRVEKFLVERGWSSYKLSRKTSLPTQTIQNILSAKNKDVRLSTLIMIAHGFDITLNELLGDGFDYNTLEFDKF